MKYYSQHNNPFNYKKNPDAGKSDVGEIIKTIG